VGFLRGCRADNGLADRPFDIVIGGMSPAGPAAGRDLVGLLADLGITWWDERMPWGDDLERTEPMLRRIEHGTEAEDHAGNLSPPFVRRELSDENLRSVTAFSGNPCAELRRWAEGFVVAVGDPEEPMAHQFGTIPVGLQLLFGVSELAIHHDDLADARGSRYQPRGAVVQALVPVWERVLGGLPPGANDWAGILAASGR
jgi:hypothetical protein